MRSEIELTGDSTMENRGSKKVTFIRTKNECTENYFDVIPHLLNCHMDGQNAMKNRKKESN